MKDCGVNNLISRRRLLGKSMLAGSLAASPSSLWAQANKAVGEAAQLSSQVELYHWADFPVEAPGAATGIAKWDVEGSCLWTHEDGAAQRTSLLWYSGSGDTYVYRFGGSLPGRWTGVTSSRVAALDGLKLTVQVTPSSNPKRTGWSGQRPDEPTAWAHQQGPEGTLVKCTPIQVSTYSSFPLSALFRRPGAYERIPHSTWHWRLRPETAGLATQFSEACRCHISQAAVGPVVIVIHPPTLDHVFHLIEV
jgi:hypothetical protein